MRVLVTGANGFVGSHVVEALIENGHTPVCLVRATSNLQWLRLLKVEYRLGDITETARLPALVKDIDAIIHTAGVLRARDKDAYYRVNQHATRELACAAAGRSAQLKKFILISSQAAMGPSAALTPRACSELERPVSDYGKSKLAGEKELKCLENRIPYTILRPASVYGPRDKDIFIFFNLVNLGFSPATISKRYLQLLFVKDLAAAAVKALTTDAANGKTYALADENYYSWHSVGTTIAGAVGKKTIPLPLPDLAFHVTAAFAETFASLRRQPAILNRQKVAEMLEPYWLCDVAAARQDLLPDFTKLEFGAKITYQWYKENRWF